MPHKSVLTYAYIKTCFHNTQCYMVINQRGTEYTVTKFELTLLNV